MWFRREVAEMSLLKYSAISTFLLLVCLMTTMEGALHIAGDGFIQAALIYFTVGEFTTVFLLALVSKKLFELRCHSKLSI